MDVTLFEFDVDNASFTANAPFSGASSGSEADDSGGDEPGSEPDAGVGGGRGRLLAALAGLGALALLAWLRRRGETEELSVSEAGETVPAE